MELIPAKKSELPAIYKSMERDFIRDELRDYTDFESLCGNGKFTVYHIEEDGARLGFITVWALEGFAFAEHFVIYEEYRNNGCGGRALEIVKDKFGALVLEAETPTEPIKKRRIGFYSRHGMLVNPQDYMQPPYRRGGAACPMKLLSYPHLLSDFDGTVKQIYSQVYQIRDGE